MNKEIFNSKLSILIVSCDRYSDVWEPFFKLFWRYWSDCPYQVYLGSNQIRYPDPRITPVLTENDRSWAESTRKMIMQMESDYILLLLEDFLLRKPVNSQDIELCFQALQKLGGGYLRLRPFPKPDSPIQGYPLIGEIKPGAPYRTALQAAIWRKDILLRLLKDGETAWDMELKGSRRSDDVETGFYCTWKPLIVYRAGVTSGKWVPFAVELCKKEGINIDFSKRSKMTYRENWNRNKRVFIGWLMDLMPWEYRRPIGNFLRRMKNALI